MRTLISPLYFLTLTALMFLSSAGVTMLLIGSVSMVADLIRGRFNPEHLKVAGAAVIMPWDLTLKFIKR